MPPRRTAALLIAATILTACGSSGNTATVGSPAARPTSQPPQPTIDIAGLDPCTLVDRDVLSTAVMGALPPGDPQPDVDGQRACLFDAPDLSTSVLVLISRQPAPAGVGEERAGQLPEDGRAEELHGVGEAAWFDYCPACPDPTATTLTVVEPPLEFTIALVLPAEEMSRRVILEDLARGVIDEVYR